MTRLWIHLFSAFSITFMQLMVSNYSKQLSKGFGLLWVWYYFLLKKHILLEKHGMLGNLCVMPVRIRWPVQAVTCLVNIGTFRGVLDNDGWTRVWTSWHPTLGWILGLGVLPIPTSLTFYVLHLSHAPYMFYNPPPWNITSSPKCPSSPICHAHDFMITSIVQFNVDVMFVGLFMEIYAWIYEFRVVFI